MMLQEGVDFDTMTEYYRKEKQWIKQYKPLEVTIFNATNNFLAWFIQGVDEETRKKVL